MRSPVAVSLALSVSVLLLAADASAQTQTKNSAAWTGCCGLALWAEPGAMDVRPRGSGGLFQGFDYIVGGSPLRHHLGVTGQIPAAYAKLSNPLSPTPQNVQRGAAVYDAHCASCHGATGLGDGPASRALKPQPAHLGWLAKVPPAQRDAFIYWSIANGGANLETDMPAYEGKLTEEEIWSVTGYIQARLPPLKAR